MLAQRRHPSSLYNSFALRQFGGKLYQKEQGEPPERPRLFGSHALFKSCHLTFCFLSLVVQDVPSMGDSISEGIVETYVKSK